MQKSSTVHFFEPRFAYVIKYLVPLERPSLSASPLSLYPSCSYLSATKPPKIGDPTKSLIDQILISFIYRHKFLFCY